MRRSVFIFTGLLALSIILSSSHADAALGGKTETLSSDRKMLNATQTTSFSSSKGYTVQEFVSDATTVREYITSDGIVFGIAWKGYNHPDLTQLLGGYWNEYDAALKKTARKHGVRRQQIKSVNITVEKWGHMRNLGGRAYAAALIPEGVSIDEIR